MKVESSQTWYSNMNKYEFTTTDMTDGLKELASLFHDFVGNKTSVLEIGVWEGCSACWFLDYLLTHPQAKYTGVDLYGGSYELRYIIAINNLSKHPGKTRLFRADSSSILPKLYEVGERFDIIHVDGCHSYDKCKDDLENAWKLLNKDGIILVDDYARDDYGVRQAVDEFLEGHKTETPRPNVTYIDYMIAWRK